MKIRSKTLSDSGMRRYFIGASNTQIIRDDESAFQRPWRGMRGEVVVQLGAATEDLNRRRYERITDRMPIGWYIAAVCYATAVILLGWWPWSILLILLLFSSSKRLQLSVIDSAGESGGFRRGGSCR